MKIIEHVNTIRDRARSHGNYTTVADQAGVSFHWLQKFAIGGIKNPTIENVSKLECFFNQLHSDNDDVSNF